MHRLVLASLLSATLASPALAQSEPETLADIRQELTVLYVEIQKLKRELSTTGGAQVQVAGSVLDRVNAIEAELTKLTSKTEALEFRLNSIVEDGTNRIGDLEFRLCEAEPGCDIASLGDTPRLGGAAGAAPVEEAPAGPAVPLGGGAPESGGAELAMSERADFEAAQAALEAGNYQQAAEQFAAFTTNYPGGPLSGEAHFLRGEALAAAGDTSAAARAYLESFSGSPAGPRAADALLRLGVSLGALGQTREACVTLSEVGFRFPGAPAVAQAQAAMAELACG